MKTVFCVENWPVFMKFPDTVLLGGKRFVFYWKGQRAFSTPKGTISQKLLLKRPFELQNWKVIEAQRQSHTHPSMGPMTTMGGIQANAVWFHPKESAFLQHTHGCKNRSPVVAQWFAGDSLTKHGAHKSVHPRFVDRVFSNASEIIPKKNKKPAWHFGPNQRRESGTELVPLRNFWTYKKRFACKNFGRVSVVLVTATVVSKPLTNKVTGRGNSIVELEAWWIFEKNPRIFMCLLHTNKQGLQVSTVSEPNPMVPNVQLNCVSSQKRRLGFVVYTAAGWEQFGFGRWEGLQ